LFLRIVGMTPASYRRSVAGKLRSRTSVAPQAETAPDRRGLDRYAA